jgi:hypothetical protein
MNNLKSILEKKKSEVKEVVGDRKWYKRVAAERRERPSSAVRVLKHHVEIPLAVTR